MSCSFWSLFLVLVAQAVSLNEEYVLMPNNRWYHSSCVHHVEDGEVPSSPCPYSSRPLSVEDSGNLTKKGLGYYSSWVANAQYVHSKGFGNQYTEWNVPAAPKSFGPAPPLVASSIYLFNGLEDGGGVRGQATVILQPVLSFGKSGCILFNTENWFLTSFVVNGAGRAVCGNKIGPLTEGEVVSGNMTLLDTDTNQWLVESSRLKTGEVSSNTVSGMPLLDSAYLTLEAMVSHFYINYPIIVF